MSPFKDLQEYIKIPRVSSLRISPDGSRLVCTVQTPRQDGRSFDSALWQVNPAGDTPARRLTRSEKGESAAAFTHTGDLLFVSARGEEDTPSLWLLPVDGGEARRIASRPGGITGVHAAQASPVVVFPSSVLPGEAGGDEARRKARKDAGVAAILHEGFPVRNWDADLGPDQPRLFAASLPADPESGLVEPRDLTPDPGRALDDAAGALTPDGTSLLTSWAVPEAGGEIRQDLVAVDVRTGERRTLASAQGHDHAYGGPIAISADGRFAACLRSSHPTEELPPSFALWLVDLESGEGRELGEQILMQYATFARDRSVLYFCADDHGRRPVFRADLASGEVVRLTPDDAAYTDLCAGPEALYALRSTVAEPPAPVRIDMATGEVVPLRGPAEPVEVPGTLTEVHAVADDGAELRAWLALPDGASEAHPVPLILAVHGGPLGSWTGWQWRWNPWAMAARGYAVLMPDPCLSTGYGPGMLTRGWGSWGPRTYADLMAVTDACVVRPEIDASRTAAIGGSFGGYMANWIAGHTDRFRAIVSHASLWDIDGFYGTTDYALDWHREYGSPGGPGYARNDPRRALGEIRTPMLVIHGDRDYRVPISQSKRLFWDLIASGVEAKYLYFPDENHWINRPGNIAVWYETVLAFLGTHVLGSQWRRPELL
ncbi:S9 family peptidase [Rhizohabitans arisaemae]|uniref:S9 family peptidase n=1 Tax=Rhizohabitans arisaemae TaxID=2720610 RepID=UPI0024B0C530|nr:S9 family peptidase [Rhizohabitans arisaemae]